MDIVGFLCPFVLSELNGRHSSPIPLLILIDNQYIPFRPHLFQLQPKTTPQNTKQSVSDESNQRVSSLNASRITPHLRLPIRMSMGRGPAGKSTSSAITKSKFIRFHFRTKRLFKTRKSTLTKSSIHRLLQKLDLFPFTVSIPRQPINIQWFYSRNTVNGHFHFRNCSDSRNLQYLMSC